MVAMPPSLWRAMRAAGRCSGGVLLTLPLPFLRAPKDSVVSTCRAQMNRWNEWITNGPNGARILVIFCWRCFTQPTQYILYYIYIFSHWHIAVGALAFNTRLGEPECGGAAAVGSAAQRFNQKNAEFTESRGHFLFAGPGSLLAGCLPGSSLQMIGGRDAFCGEAGRLDVLQTLEAALGVLAVQDMVDSVARSCQATV